jgi:hypothetical protein
MSPSTDAAPAQYAPPRPRRFPWTFWNCNLIEMFERLAFYTLRVMAPIYIMQADDPGGLHLTASQKGVIYAWWAVFQSILPMATGGFADRYHLRYHRGEYLRFLQRVRHGTTFGNGSPGLADRLLNHRVAGRVRDNIHRFENGDPACQHGAQGSSEAGHGNLAKEHSEDRGLEQEPIRCHSAFRILANPADEKDQQNDPYNTPDKIANGVIAQ